MPQCCAYGCYTSQDKGTKFFRIPRAESDENRRNVWLARINRVNWTPTESSRLCDKHFTEDQFEKRCADSVRKLKPNAIPSVFEHTSARKTTKPHRLRSKVVLMELIKTEPEVDPLAPENEHRNIEEGNLLSIEGDFLKVDINEVKVESSDLNCAYVSDITYDESKLDITSFSGLKYENEEESYNVDAVKEELIPDATTKDENWAMDTHFPDEVTDFEVDKISVECHIASNAEDVYPQDHAIFTADKKNFKCDVCEMIFPKQRFLRRHQIIHSWRKDFRCNVCNKGFSRRPNLCAHALIHTGEKRFKCCICEMSFTRHHRHLRKHEATHTSEKPFKCTMKSFKLLQYVKAHILTHSKVDGNGLTSNQKTTDCNRCHKEDNVYKCGICCKDFLSQLILDKHTLTHTRK
ncbi:uncharacterized protein [Periplaneta americana]|uniref:uncharacterized protein isoform X4 n=1 Tax=Periplaneta americana TaxID=6978 RepID=UPI0037E974EF